jgi:hypothetical protein
MNHDILLLLRCRNERSPHGVIDTVAIVNTLKI